MNQVTKKESGALAVIDYAADATANIQIGDAANDSFRFGYSIHLFDPKN